LLETTRTLLIHGKVPQCFWGDNILSACYLTNRMSSSALENKIPHSILFPHESLHLLPLKMTFVRLFIVITTLQRWSLYQLDVKNSFLNGDL